MKNQLHPALILFLAVLAFTLLAPSANRGQAPVVSSQEDIKREVNELFEMLMRQESVVQGYNRINYLRSNISGALYEQILESLIIRLESAKSFATALNLAKHLTSRLLIANQLNDAVRLAELSVSLARSLGDTREEIEQLDLIAKILEDRGNFKAVHEVRKRAVTAARGSNNQELLIRELFKFASSSHYLMRDRLTAMTTWEEVIAIGRDNGFPAFVGFAHLSRGIIFLSTFFHASAFQELSAALAYQSYLNPTDEFMIRQGLGESLLNLGRAEESVSHFERAIALAREAEAENQLIDLHINLGVSLAQARRYIDSGESYEKAVEIARAGNDKEKLHEALDRQAYFNLMTRVFDAAERDYQEILRDSTKKDFYHTEALIGLGEVFFEQGRFDEALDRFKEAAELAKAGGWFISEGAALLGIGSVNARLGRNPEAEKAFDDVRKTLTSLQRVSLPEGVALLKIGEWKLSRGKYEEALEDLQRALVIISGSRVVERELYTIYNLMLVNDKLGNRDVAVAYGKRLINLTQDARFQFRYQTDAFKKNLFEDKIKFYRGLADILIDLGRLPEAEQVLTMLKEDEFSEFVRKETGRAGGSDLIAVTPQESDFLKQLTIYVENYYATNSQYLELKFLREALRGTDKFDEKFFESTEAAKNNAERDLQSLFVSYRGGAGFSKSEVVPETSKIQEQLESLKQGNVASISTVVGDKRLRLILTTGEGQQTFTVNAERADVNRLVAQFRSELLNPMSDPKPIGKKLFDLVFPRALVDELEKSKIETLLWSLDGALRYVPIAALWDGERYVVERYNTVMLSLAGGERQFEASDGLRNDWKGLGLGTSRDVTVRQPDGKTTTFSALYAVPEEICSVVNDKSEGSPCMDGISAEPGKIEGKALIDEQFTIESFKRNVKMFPVVHVASHFYLNPGNDRESFLLLGGGTDPRLTLDAISTDSISFNQVEILTLSACNTAVGSGVGSDGFEVEGFGVLALSKGARTVVASLWPVADNSTRDLMISFYDGLTRSEMTRANALRLAQLRLLRGASADGESQRAAKFAHPYYWSPFMLIGNWQ